MNDHAEIELVTCRYMARCSVKPCPRVATAIARYLDNQGRPLRQRDLCDRHANVLKKREPNIRDLRETRA